MQSIQMFQENWCLQCQESSDSVEQLENVDEAGAAGTWLLVTVFCQALVRAAELCNHDTQALVISWLLKLFQKKVNTESMSTAFLGWVVLLGLVKEMGVNGAGGLQTFFSFFLYFFFFPLFPLGL